MVRQFDLAALRHATAPATRIRITIAIATKNIRTTHILLQQIRRTLITRRQSMRAAETDIAAILTQAPRAARAALALHNTVTTTQDRHLPILVADLDHLRIQARRPDQVRLLDLVHPAPRLPIPLLLVRTLHRTQATAHRRDQAIVRRLHLRPRHLPRRRIRAEAVVRHNKSWGCKTRAGLTACSFYFRSAVLYCFAMQSEAIL